MLINMSTLNKMDNKIWIDYSSLSTFLRCPRMYWWRYMEHITQNAPSAALINGKAYHDALAQYYMSRESIGHQMAKAKALNSLLSSELMLIKDDPKRNITVAMDTINRYLDIWEHEEYKTLDVDIGFAVDMNTFMYVGKIDRVVDSPTFGTMIMEHKTTTIMGERWLSRARPNLQIDGYIGAYYITTGAMPSGAVLDVIPINDKKVVKPIRIVTTRSKFDMEQWAIDVQSWFYLICCCIEDKYFPMNTENCIPLLGYSCNYHQLCSMYPSPKHGEYDLPNEFKIEEWEPWNIKQGK